MRIPKWNFLLIASWLIIATCPAFAQTTNQTTNDDPNLAAGPHGHGSRLDPGNTILIDAPIAISLPDNPAGTSACYSIKNTSLNAYFVPWNSAQEWSSFLGAAGASQQISQALQIPATAAVTPWLMNQITISSCCSPQTVGTVCTTTNSTITSNAELGSRYIGTPTGDSPYWGANGDDYYVDASAVSGNTSVDYSVTWTCKSGDWVKTHESGSCLPLNGQCASGTTGITSLPASTDSLCAAGSLFGGFTNGSSASAPGPWTWTCLGTPGMANADCSSQPTTLGCGTAISDTPDWVPPAANLCQGTATPSAITGPNNLNTLGSGGSTYNNTTYNWTCTDTSGTVSSCTAPYAASCSGGMGNVVNGVLGTAAPDPTKQLLCDSGQPSSVVYEQNPWGFETKMAWVWYCELPAYGLSTSWDECALFDKNSGAPTDGDPNPGLCGPANGVGTGTQPVSGLCAQGTSTGAWTDGASWYWTCVGSTGENTGCTAPNVWLGQCGGSEGVSSSTAPTDLCSAGWAGQITSDGSAWYWTCTGAWSNPINCSAPETASGGGGGSIPADACGDANGSTFASTPSADLCAGGTPSTVTDTGSGQWIWTCTSGGSTASCSASNTDTGPGACGAADSTTIPNIPNQNLCSSGGPSIVTGTGPWSWSCIGDGAHSGQNASCSANFCQACTGSPTQNGVTTPTVSGTYTGCAVTGHASYTETDGLSNSNTAMQLQWSDAFYGNFSTIISPGAGPTSDCQPCHKVAQSVTNVQVTVKAAAGSCPSNSALNGGQAVTFGVSGATLTPQ